MCQESDTGGLLAKFSHMYPTGDVEHDQRVDRGYSKLNWVKGH